MGEIKVTREPGATELRVSRGGKQVVATVITEGPKARAYTKVDNTPEERKSGITTLLYSLVRIFFQRQANELKKPVEYILTTENPQIAAWAQDAKKGGKAMKWDEVSTPDKTEDGSLVAKKTFKPK